MQIIQNRRSFIASAAAVGAASMFGAGPALAETPPETASARFVDFPGGVCIAPQYIAEGLLRGEGFTDFQLRTSGCGDNGVSPDCEESKRISDSILRVRSSLPWITEYGSRRYAAFMSGAGS